MVRDVADIDELLSLRLDPVAGVADRVPGRRDRQDAGHKLCAVLDEHQAIAVRQQILARPVTIIFIMSFMPALASSVQKSKSVLGHIDFARSGSFSTPFSRHQAASNGRRCA